jgi:alkylation response protein AidB-like acyl-CoA dehydrogenase
MSGDNPLVDDRDVTFLLHEVHDATGLTALPAFAAHDRETFELYLDSARRLAREALWPAYRAMDEHPPRLEPDGRVRAHPAMHELWRRMVDLGLLSVTRPEAVGGMSLPLLVSTAADAYLMAANLAAFGYVGLTRGAAHLIEAFGTDALRERYMAPMLEGRFTGTMALTEPHAGSSLADVTTRAIPTGEGHYLVVGAKIFISAADHGLTDNVVNMTLARIEGAPAGTAGISLLAVPQRRPAGDGWVDNDVRVSGAIHKIGWRGLPSLALSFGERGDCHGWLVGAEHQGLRCMFQMMNEARIMIGLNGVATASVAYHESLRYARERPQGRAHGDRDPTRPQVPIIEHADVRRMLLRQKAIVEGGLSLVMQAARWADVATHGSEPDRSRAAALLDLVTPIVKSFPAERGFLANALALQIHGGYGYTSEYLPEAWLRDQKLNSIHEGTTGIQALDLLGRKVLRDRGRSLALLGQELAAARVAADAAGVDPRLGQALAGAMTTLAELVAHLGARALADEAEALAHATDFLDLACTVVVAWQWLRQATAATRALAEGRGHAGFLRGKLAAAACFFDAELPRVAALDHRCRHDRSYLGVDPQWL